MRIARKLLICSAIGALLGLFMLSSEVLANPVDYIYGPFAFKYTDYEFAAQPASGVNIGGIFTVTGITEANTSHNMWVAASFSSPISDGTELNGYFSDITLNVFTPNGSGGDFTATGGLLVMYDEPYNTFNASTFPTTGINPTSQLCGGVACGTPWLTALFVPGYGWLNIPASDNTDTLFGNFTNTNPIGGTGNGYLSVADVGGMTVVNGNGGGSFTLPSSPFIGSENGFFDSNGYTFSGVGAPSPADLLLKSNFNQCGYSNSPSGCSAVGGNTDTAWSNDPVTGQPVVPEPSTLILLGLGLGILGFKARHKA